MRPGVIGYSRRMRLPSTTPQPAAFKRGVDVFGSGFGFVHGRSYSSPVKAWCSSDFFNASSAASFPPTETREVFSLGHGLPEGSSTNSVLLKSALAMES